MDTLENEIKGIVFDIQRFSIQDGPGIRTTVFLKGCPLTCLWCSNPESQSQKTQLLFSEFQCNRCYRCVQVCPKKANSIKEDGSIEYNREACNMCGECIPVCMGNARRMSGKVMTVNEVMEVVNRDNLFYYNSEGGVTVSGGEAAEQPAFVSEIFKRCHEDGINTTLDTSGFSAWSNFERILEDTDLVLYDIKHMDSDTHRKLTGVGNELILDNARKIVEKGIPLIIRIPLIPGLNDSEENLRRTGKFAVELGGVEVNLLPYHRFGLGKYEALGLKYTLNAIPSMSDEEVKDKAAILKEYGIPIDIV